jgi:hypothetical protein
LGGLPRPPWRTGRGPPEIPFEFRPNTIPSAGDKQGLGQTVLRFFARSDVRGPTGGAKCRGPTPWMTSGVHRYIKGIPAISPGYSPGYLRPAGKGRPCPRGGAADPKDLRKRRSERSPSPALPVREATMEKRQMEHPTGGAKNTKRFPFPLDSSPPRVRIPFHDDPNRVLGGRFPRPPHAHQFKDPP